MKISRLIIPAFASVALLSACSEEPQESTKKPVNPEQPEEPTPDNPSGDIVSPVPSFTCNTEKTSIDPAKQFQTIEGFGCQTRSATTGARTACNSPAGFSLKTYRRDSPRA